MCLIISAQVNTLFLHTFSSYCGYNQISGTTFKNHLYICHYVYLYYIIALHIAETGFAEGSSIADSLKQFAKRRSDIFGGNSAGSSGGVGGTSGSEADRARQLEEEDKEEVS